VTVAEERVRLTDLSIRFRLSYDKSHSLGDWIRETGLRLARGRRPRTFTALRNVNLTLRDGDVLGVIGPNGCGKSTLLRTISGIYRPDEGEVRTQGQVSTLLSLGTGFDNRLDGLSNIRLNGLLMGMSHEEIDAATPDIVAFAEIGEHIDVPMKYYSSGMISRLSFAIVLAMQPDILLIDEIFSVGDLEFKKKSEKAMHDLLTRASCQVIVTHSLRLVREHCTRAIYMRSGRILMDGEPEEVVARYEADVERLSAAKEAAARVDRGEPADEDAAPADAPAPRTVPDDED